MMKRYLLLLTVGLIAFIQASAQSVEAKIDPIEMLIGQHARVTLTVTAAGDAKVVFPGYKRTEQLTPGVEVIDSTDTKMQRIDNGMTTYSKVYTLTSFDDTLYYLPPFKVKVNGKTVESKSLALKVITFDVDTTKLDQFYGPKDVQDNPFSWDEWQQPFWLSVLMLVLLIVGGWLFVRLKQNKPIITRIKIIHKLLPHQKALNEIATIKAERLTTAEDSKEYYTKLTETLRKYIEERYGFNAMEMTSAEIIDRLTAERDQAKIDELRQLFQTADLVKFAKYSTMINENDANLMSAVAFINETKIENQPTEEKIVPKLSEEDKKTKKARRWLKTLIGIITAVCVALLVYVVYIIYQLMI